MRRLVPVVLLVLVACSKKDPEPSAAPPVPTMHIEGTPAASLTPPPAAGDVAWTAPAAWQTAPNPSAMRKATYKIPKAAGDTEDAELSVMSAMGGADANIKRWAGQFGDAQPKTETRTVNGLKVTVTEIHGTYASGGMMGGPATPKPKSMLLGAIVEAGQQEYFFKLTGPEATVTAARKDFDALVASVHAK